MKAIPRRYEVATRQVGKFKHGGLDRLLLTAEKYINGAIAQRERILDDMRWDHGSFEVKHSMIFLDVHYYFICCARVRHLLQAMAARDGDPELIGIANRMKKKTGFMNDARKLLEHVEDYISLEDSSEFSVVTTETYTFAGEDFDISEVGLEHLTKAYEEMISVLEKRPIDPSFLDLLKRIQKDGSNSTFNSR
ncbi:MAG TPA: hypothetical protein VGR56_07160 [Nitrososphaerales archaeon]|nr:hypothetical protein [Nitrososphaerales archaeon]